LEKSLRINSSFSSFDFPNGRFLTNFPFPSKLTGELSKGVMEESEDQAYHQLAYYTLAHPNPSFIHQNIVDAYAAQNANEDTKPIKIVFALVGLYLCLEKGYTGRQTQLAHMELAMKRKTWPKIVLPEYRGDISARDVLLAQPGPERDAAIFTWCQSVWDAYKNVHQKIADLVKMELKV